MNRSFDFGCTKKKIKNTTKCTTLVVLTIPKMVILYCGYDENKKNENDRKRKVRKSKKRLFEDASIAFI
jgi:hypothetical protein